MFKAVMKALNEHDEYRNGNWLFKAYWFVIYSVTYASGYVNGWVDGCIDKLRRIL